MDWQNFHSLLVITQRGISFCGVLVILSGVLMALYSYLRLGFSDKEKHMAINSIRLILARRLVLGLEFIVAADLIGTTIAPDYYSLGILAAIVAIRTLLSYSLNRELISLTKER